MFWNFTAKANCDAIRQNIFQIFRNSHHQPYDKQNCLKYQLIKAMANKFYLFKEGQSKKYSISMDSDYSSLR